MNKRAKKLAVILLIACLTLYQTAIILKPIRANALNVYALIIADDAYLYRTTTMDETLENRYFLLPKTYFVQIITQNVTSSLSKVRYRDIEGYCLTEKLDIKDYTPKSIYPPEVYLKVSIEGPLLNLRSRPDTSASIIEEIPRTATGIEYYNISIGTVASVSGSNNVWYFVNYKKDADSYSKGYIYSDYIILETAIPMPNDTTALIPPITDAPEPPAFSGDLENADDLIRIIIIISITIPGLAIIFFLFKPLKTRSTKI